MQLWLFLAVSCKSVKLNEDTACFSIYINEACSKSNVQRTLWHNNYYHRDTTACTHADIIKLFFNITTPVEPHVPAIYTSAVKSWSSARNNAVTAPHYDNHNHHHHHDPQAVVPKRVPSEDCARCCNTSHTSGTTAVSTGLWVGSQCTGA
jgi:hypothetical protein